MSLGRGIGSFADGLMGGMQMSSMAKDFKSKKEPTIKDEKLANATAQNPPVPTSGFDKATGGASSGQAPAGSQNQQFSVMADIMNQVGQSGGQMDLGPQQPVAKTLPQQQMPPQPNMAFSLK